MTDDRAICSKCWMQLRKMVLQIPSRFSLTAQKWWWKQKIEAIVKGCIFEEPQ